jgi:HSP20 family protein
MKSLIPFGLRFDARHPLSAFPAIPGELDRVFGRLFEDPSAGPSSWTAGFRLDLHEMDEAYRIEAELPGVVAEDLDITVKDDVLVLAGEKKTEVEETEGSCTHSERVFGTFRRSIQLPGPVEASAVEATMANGVLTLLLPKSMGSRPRRIEVTKAS